MSFKIRNIQVSMDTDALELLETDKQHNDFLAALGRQVLYAFTHLEVEQLNVGVYVYNDLMVEAVYHCNGGHAEYCNSAPDRTFLIGGVRHADGSYTFHS